MFGLRHFEAYCFGKIVSGNIQELVDYQQLENQGLLGLKHSYMSLTMQTLNFFVLAFGFTIKSFGMDRDKCVF